MNLQSRILIATSGLQGTKVVGQSFKSLISIKSRHIVDEVH